MSINRNVLKYLLIIIVSVAFIVSAAGAVSTFPFSQSTQDILKKYSAAHTYKFPITIKADQTGPIYNPGSFKSGSITITKVANKYVTGNVKGVDPASYEVAVYIFVPDYGWVNKPYWARPKTTIQSDGTFMCQYVTGGHDWDATKFIAFLIPKGKNVPVLRGSQTIPSELYRYPFDQYP